MFGVMLLGGKCVIAEVRVWTQDGPEQYSGKLSILV